jgi:type I restriction enzyme S subunit
MSEDGFKNLPAGWVKARIGNVVSRDGIFVDGDWVESEDQDPTGNVRLIQLADVGDGVYRNRSSRFLTENKAYELRCTFLKAGDVLIARMPDPLGRACIFPGDPKKSVTAVDVCIVRTGANGANHRWLMWAINSPHFRTQVAALQSGSTRKRISRSNVATIEMPIPPLSEQHRIVAEIEKQFTRLDAGVAALERAQANLKRYRASVLKAACEGRLVPTEAELARAESRDYEPADRLLVRIVKKRRAKWETNQLAKMQAQGKAPKDDKWKEKYQEPAGPDTTALPELPEGWCYATLGQLAWDASYGTSEKCDYSFTGPPVLRIPNLGRGRINLANLKFATSASKLNAADALVPGDFLIIRTNGSKDLIGRGALVRQAFGPAHFFASYLIRFRIVNMPQVADWLCQLWHASRTRAWIEQIAATSAGQYNVSLSSLSGAVIPLPPLTEQQRIVSELERRLSVIDELEAVVSANLKRAERLRQSILKHAFEGKLVPQDPHDEPASVLLERIRAERTEREMVGATGRSPLQTGSKKRNSRVSDTQAELFR